MGWTRALRLAVARPAAWLRDRWILWIVIAAAAIAAILAPAFPPLSGWVAPLGGASVLAVFLDRIGAWYGQQSESAVGADMRAILSGLLTLLDEAGRLDRSADEVGRRAQEGALTRLAAETAARVLLAEDVRATYYRLTYDRHGWRELREPVSRGRLDHATTEFFEVQAPDHSVWKVLDAPDVNCRIHREGDPVPHVDWDVKPYKAFLSVPVTSNGKVLGMLSVNTPDSSGLSETDRMAVLAITRTLATALVLA
jgi:hypothetical protein